MKTPFPVARPKACAGGGAIVLALVSACAAPAAGPPGTADLGRGQQVIHIVTTDGTIEVSRTGEPRLDRPLALTRAAAWEALPSAFESLSLPVDFVSEGEWRMGVSEHRFGSRILDRRPSDFFNCGLDPGLNTPLADRARIDARIISTVLPAAGGSASLRTEVTGRAWRTGGSGGRAECRSTGLLEIVLARMVEERAR